MPSSDRSPLWSELRAVVAVAAPMWLAAAPMWLAAAAPLLPSTFPEISGGTACDEDNPKPGTCNCSGMPMGPESWRLTKPEWFKSSLGSAFDTHAILRGVNTSLAAFRGHKATMVINIASA